VTIRVAVFASGTGTNLQALLDHLNRRDDSPARVTLVISDRADAGALSRAATKGIDARVIPVSGLTEHDVATAMLGVLTSAGIDLIALAGYLRLVPAEVVRGYRGRIVNIHPALLPAFGGKGMYGMRVHRAVLEAGCTITGVTVHHVDERYDEGRPIAQWPVPVVRGDTAESLASRVLAVEHVLYPLAVEWLARRMTETRATTHACGFPAAAGDAAFVLAHADRDVDAEVRRALGINEETNP
jgi:formyltetrahydrofolate-dependent phosphoribosylglycinamide formyltransferase